MKQLLVTGAVIALCTAAAAPVAAAPMETGFTADYATFIFADDEVDRRGRRGRGGRSGGRSKPRVPGGSGCDDPGDIAEHPECRR